MFTGPTDGRVRSFRAVPQDDGNLERDERRALSAGSRNLVYGIALGVLLFAVVLAALRVGEEAGGLSDWQALVLGITQGATELLPISSSGHLILVPWLGDWHYLETHDAFNKTFDVALHLGTLVAVVVYFWHDVVRYTVAWFRSVGARAIRNDDERTAWAIAAATVPAAVVGAVGEDAIDKHLGEPWQIAIFLALFGILLWIADRTAERYRLDELRFGQATAVGLSQILALMPGVSRSGVTITAGRFTGLNRDAAARFSFLLLIPIVFGAVLYKGVKHVLLNPLPPGSTGPFLVGTIASAAVGLIAIDLLLGYVRRHDYTPFVVYRLLAAAFVVVVILSGWRGATF
jgi:undecaprenyl-diphosphatase